LGYFFQTLGDFFALQSPVVNFTNILRAAFSNKSFLWLQFGFVKFWPNDFGAKGAHKMLVKLTPEAVFLAACDPSMKELFAT
jgi:hypothetical protein